MNAITSYALFDLSACRAAWPCTGSTGLPSQRTDHCQGFRLCHTHTARLGALSPVRRLCRQPFSKDILLSFVTPLILYACLPDWFIAIVSWPVQAAGPRQAHCSGNCGRLRPLPPQCHCAAPPGTVGLVIRQAAPPRWHSGSHGVRHASCMYAWRAGLWGEHQSNPQQWKSQLAVSFR